MAKVEALSMQSSLGKDEFGANASVAPVSEPVSVGERVLTEPIDEYGIIFLETRIAPDGTKRTRKVTRKGWPVRSIEECMQMNDPFPPEPD